MDAANPARQMALIRETRSCGNLGKAEFPVSNHFDRPSQSQMNDVAMRAHADRSGEGARKMELAAVRHFRKRRDVKWFVQMFENEILQPLENVEGQRAVPLRADPNRVTCRKNVDKLAGGLIPEQRAVRMTLLAFPRQHPGQIKKRLVVAAETTAQLRFELSFFGGGERKFVRLNRNKERVQILVGIGAGIKPGRTDRQGSFVRRVMQSAPRQAARDPCLRNEGDQVLPKISPEMRAALVTQAHDGDTAFTRHAAACQYCRRGAIFLGSEDFANI